MYEAIDHAYRCNYYFAISSLGTCVICSPLDHQYSLLALAGYLQKLDLSSVGLSCAFPAARLVLFRYLETLVLSENPKLTVRSATTLLLMHGVHVATTLLANI